LRYEAGAMELALWRGIMLTIFEAIFILAIDDEEGGLVESVVTALEPALSGAVLVELVLQNKTSLIENRIVVIDQTPTDHPILDKALFDMIDTSKTRKLKYWINNLIYKKVQDEIGRYMVDQNVLVRKKKRLHLVVPYGDSSDGNASKHALKNRLREIVLGSQPAELSEKILLAFLYHGDLLKLVFTPGERKAAHKRVKKLIANEDEAKALGEPFEEIIASTFGLE
jgi:hypothetical protein